MAERPKIRIIPKTSNPKIKIMSRHEAPEPEKFNRIKELDFTQRDFPNLSRLTMTAHSSYDNKIETFTLMHGIQKGTKLTLTGHIGVPRKQFKEESQLMGKINKTPQEKARLQTIRYELMTSAGVDNTAYNKLVTEGYGPEPHKVLEGEPIGYGHMHVNHIVPSEISNNHYIMEGKKRTKIRDYYNSLKQGHHDLWNLPSHRDIERAVGQFGQGSIIMMYNPKLKKHHAWQVEQKKVKKGLEFNLHAVKIKG